MQQANAYIGTPQNRVDGRAKVTATGGRTAAINVKLSKKALRALRKATARGKAKIVLTVRATDAAGNRSSASRRVAVRR